MRQGPGLRNRIAGGGFMATRCSRYQIRMKQHGSHVIRAVKDGVDVCTCWSGSCWCVWVGLRCCGDRRQASDQESKHGPRQDSPFEHCRARRHGKSIGQHSFLCRVGLGLCFFLLSTSSTILQLCSHDECASRRAYTPSAQKRIG
jgi:hypothetical protein